MGITSFTNKLYALARMYKMIGFNRRSILKSIIINLAVNNRTTINSIKSNFGHDKSKIMDVIYSNRDLIKIDKNNIVGFKIGIGSIDNIMRKNAERGECFYMERGLQFDGDFTVTLANLSHRTTYFNGNEILPSSVIVVASDTVDGLNEKLDKLSMCSGMSLPSVMFNNIRDNIVDFFIKEWSGEKVSDVDTNDKSVISQIITME